MQLIAITTSVNYTDYLVWCLDSLSKVADGVAVVTEHNDSALALCCRSGATPIVYDGWRTEGAVFNKGGAVRYAQEKVHAAHPDAWYLLIDADVVLPEDARSIIESHATDEEALYSARRVDFHTLADAKAGMPTKVYESIFAGFCQLYRRHVLYPEWSRSAERCDLEFAKQFESCRILPMTVGHLGREQINWEGRRSPVWGTQ